MRFSGPVLLCLMLLLQACSSGPDPSPRPGKSNEAALAIRPGYKVGIPYVIQGRRYVPVESFDYSAEGTASWYGEAFHGRLTANGEIYDMNAMTAAHKTLQLPAIVRVTNMLNGKSVIVRVNDRGPFVDDRIIDMSKGAADQLGFQRRGIAPVRVEVMADASRHLQRMASGRQSVGEMDTLVAALNAGDQPGAPVQIAAAPIPGKLVPIPQPAPAAAQIPAQVAKQLPSQQEQANWYLQAASFSDPGNAGRALLQLRHVGPTVVVPHARGARTLYLVRVGPYGNKQKAQSALERVRKVGFDDALLVASS